VKPHAILLAACLSLMASHALAVDRAVVEGQFQNWLQTTVWPAASGMGVSRTTFDAAFSGVTLNWDLPDLVPPGTEPKVPDRQHQTEFGSPKKYFSPANLSGNTATGRELARRHASTLAAVEQETGVPGQIILAIWGRESAFGRAAIPHDAFEILGTKGFMSTRASYFTEELIAALKISEAGHSAPRNMKSSWAGALGQPQFMPSNFLEYAADGDGDGKADIWRSEADTIASIGNYLSEHGWVSGRDWGFEVDVPATVSCSLEGPDQGRNISEWASMGIARVSGKPFPAQEVDQVGFLLMPAGRHGPAFIVTPNFYVLKDYNMSDLYALFVGHVGDRIRYGMSDFTRPWGDVGGLYRSDVASMQRALEAQGYDVGGADGLAGFKTRRSIGDWEHKAGRRQTCFPAASMKSALKD